MMVRTAASPRIARGAAAAAAAALKKTTTLPLPRVKLAFPRPIPSSTPMVKPLRQHLRPPPAASLSRAALPISSPYLGEKFVPLASAARSLSFSSSSTTNSSRSSSRQRGGAVISSPALGKDRLVLVTLGSDDEDELERAPSSCSSSTSTTSDGGLSATSPLPPLRGGSSRNRSSKRRKKKRPLVILFGWLGARAKDLSKYAEAWQALGYDTLTARPPLAAVLLPPLGARAADSVLSLAREALLSREGEEEEGDRKVIAHVFSNAGFLFSGTCLAREAEEEVERRRRQQQQQEQQQQSSLLLRSRLRGVIFDSCPARVDEDMALRGISAAARGVPAARAAREEDEEEEGEEGRPSSSTSTPTSTSTPSSPHSILSPPIPPPRSSSSPSLRDSALKLALRAFLRSGPIERAMDAAWRAWEGPQRKKELKGQGGGESSEGGDSSLENDDYSSPPPSCPRFYAYSLTDALIPPESVEEVAAAAAARAEEEEQRKNSGKTSSSSSLLPAVSLRAFNSPHCEHLRWHPREYLRLMEKFASEIRREEEAEGEAEEEEEEEEGDAILQL